jgi:Ankyrin repeats (3 copies)
LISLAFCPQDLTSAASTLEWLMSAVGQYHIESQLLVLGKAWALLIRLGVALMCVAPPLQWSAIHHSVFYGNYGTFIELLPHYVHLDINTPDTRGWTLLHIAASAGHDRIVRHLLSLGANPSQKS